MGARADAKSNRITSPAQLNPAMKVQFGLGRTPNTQKESNGDAGSINISGGTKTNSLGLTKAADTISNLLSPSRRAEAKANAEKRAQQIIENNFYAEQSGYGWDINKLRTFQDGGVYRAENINASMLSDRDALTRVDAAKKQSDIDIQKLLGEEPQRYSTGYPAWKEGTLVTDRRIVRPEKMRMVIDDKQRRAILAGEEFYAGWATKESISSKKDMRERLGITQAFKPDTIHGKPNKFYVVEFIAMPGVGVREGVAGPMYDSEIHKIMPGGAKQINFVDQTFKSNPDLFKIDKKSIREIK